MAGIGHRDTYRSLVDALREARLKAGLTQAEVAGRLRRPQSFVAKIEGYERRVDVAEFLTIAKVVGMNPIPLLKRALEQA